MIIKPTKNTIKSNIISVDLIFSKTVNPIGILKIKIHEIIVKTIKKAIKSFQIVILVNLFTVPPFFDKIFPEKK